MKIFFWKSHPLRKHLIFLSFFRKKLKSEYSDYINAPLVILFIIVKTANKAKLTQQEEEAPAAEDYLAEIRDLLRQEQGLPIETNEDNSQTDAENSDSETIKE